MKKVNNSWFYILQLLEKMSYKMKNIVCIFLYGGFYFSICGGRSSVRSFLWREPDRASADGSSAKAIRPGGGRLARSFRVQNFSKKNFDKVARADAEAREPVWTAGGVMRRSPLASGRCGNGEPCQWSGGRPPVLGWQQTFRPCRSDGSAQDDYAGEL
ncbi:hypothetical protein [Breoghania sp.]|uniref:hypothetical protein n=1 Tax=Breoghania sp. TaxID=2065378 RepID=UPI002AA6726A|nr:hypothetical protein [Breoghania sp.]